MGVAAKAIYAAIMAGLLAAQAIYVDITWLTIVIATLTAVGVYIVPNAKQSDQTGDAGAEPLL